MFGQLRRWRFGVPRRTVLEQKVFSTVNIIISSNLYIGTRKVSITTLVSLIEKAPVPDAEACHRA